MPLIVELEECNMVFTKLGLNVTAVVLLCQIFCKVQTQQCEGETSIAGRMLKGFTFKKIEVSSPSECHQACIKNVRCQSFNYVMLKDICELNNRSKDPQ